MLSPKHRRICNINNVRHLKEIDQALHLYKPTIEQVNFILYIRQFTPMITTPLRDIIIFLPDVHNKKAFSMTQCFPNYICIVLYRVHQIELNDYILLVMIHLNNLEICVLDFFS